MSVLFFCDDYADRPTIRRGELEERVRRLKVACWADPGDRQLRDLLALTEGELLSFIRRGGDNGARS
jgi:hypothetical protein